MTAAGAAGAGPAAGAGAQVIAHALSRIVEGHDLTRAEAREAMGAIMAGEATQGQIGGLLIALRMKGECAEEIAGCAEAMRALALPVKPARTDLVDTAGTGGDGLHTLNISTAAALVAAAAGAGVAKHGNRAVSSASGSADVLEALGFRLDIPPERVAASIDELGFGFLFAPSHHPAMRHAGPVRRELATRTVFNVLGPLTNPAGARAQVVGVYAKRLVPLIADVLASLGAQRAFVVHGAHGIDELSPCGPSQVGEVRDGEVLHHTVYPEELGLPPADPEELAGGTAAQNAAAIRALFAGEGRDGAGPTPFATRGARSAILLNAAAALAAAGHAEGLRDGLALAAEAVDSGAALQRLDALVSFSTQEVTA